MYESDTRKEFTIDLFAYHSDFLNYILFVNLFSDIKGGTQTGGV
jgi:hypothetical protein